MRKFWYESKTVWGMLGFVVFSILNNFWPSSTFVLLSTLSLGWAGIGLRHALK